MNLQKPSSISIVGKYIKYIKYPLIIVATVLITKYLSPTPVGRDDEVIEYEEPKTYKDINDKIHSVIEEKNINIHSHKDYADSIAKVLDIRTKQLETVTSALSKTEVKYIDKPTTITTTKDTAYSMTKEDAWIKIHAYLSRDTGSITFSARDSLTITQYSKRTLFKTTDYIDIQHANPYIKVDKAYSLSFKRNHPRIVIGPYIGYGYIPTSNKFAPSIGIGATIPLIKIK